MLVHAFSTLMEMCTVLAVGYDQEGKWDRTWALLLGAALIAAQIAATNIWNLDIPVWIQLLIMCLWIKCFYAHRSLKETLWCGILGYAVVLLYLQAFIIIWIPQKWFVFVAVDHNGLLMNCMVFFICTAGIWFVRKAVKLDTSILKKKPFFWVVLIAAAAMLYVCQRFRTEIRGNYWDIAKWVSGLMILTQFVTLILYSVERNKQLTKMQDEYSIKLAERDYRQHDFDKWIRLSRTNQGEFASEQDQQEQILEGLDFALESVLRQYAQECQKREIDLRISATPQLPPWKPDEKDTSTIVGNLLENAMNAVQMLQSNRVINVELCGEEPFIRIQNKYDLSQKTDKKEGHGYGLRRSQNVARKYGYSVRAEKTEDMFTSIIIL
ncbi:MAG: GHKL domain-containing protein [Firmicutes bacterium]|nr:GHKL domain-containing protein [Bacillota bacterium]